MDNTKSSYSLTDELSDSEGKPINRQSSEASIYGTKDDKELSHIQLGPKCTIKEHLENDQDDESFRKWKKQLIRDVDINAIEEDQESDVKILILTILSEGRPDIMLPLTISSDPKGLWFMPSKVEVATLQDYLQKLPHLLSSDRTYQIYAVLGCSNPLQF